MSAAGLRISRCPSLNKVTINDRTRWTLRTLAGSRPSASEVTQDWTSACVTSAKRVVPHVGAVLYVQRSENDDEEHAGEDDRVDTETLCFGRTATGWEPGGRIKEAPGRPILD